RRGSHRRRGAQRRGGGRERTRRPRGRPEAALAGGGSAVGEQGTQRAPVTRGDFLATRVLAAVHHALAADIHVAHQRNVAREHEAVVYIVGGNAGERRRAVIQRQPILFLPVLRQRLA